MVLRSRPRWRAIAEIVQPWRANACASMSSSRDSMGTRGSFESACGQRPPSSKEPGPFPDGATGWGVSVSRTGEIHLSAVNRRRTLVFETPGSGSVPAKLVETLVVDAEVVGDLVHHGDRHLVDDLLFGAAHPQ